MRCCEPPTEIEPLQLACPTCNEAGCEQCDDRGFVRITECPQKLLDAEIVEFFTYSDMCQNGMPPVNGGSLDQSKWFVSAMHYLQSEDNRAQAEKYAK